MKSLQITGIYVNISIIKFVYKGEDENETEKENENTNGNIEGNGNAGKGENSQPNNQEKQPNNNPNKLQENKPQQDTSKKQDLMKQTGANLAKVSLPYTGSGSIPHFLIGIIVILVIAKIYIIIRKRR